MDGGEPERWSPGLTDHASRVDRIKRYLDEHRAEIEEAPIIQVQFDFSGHELSVKVGRIDRLRNGDGRAITMD